MGRVKIPYYAVKNGRGFWQPTAAMREAGRMRPGWSGHLADGGEMQRALERISGHREGAADYPAYASRIACRSVPTLSRDSRVGGEGTTDPRGMAARMGAHIEPVFGDVRPRTVMLEHISAFREKVEREVSRREAHPVIKIWRALWRVAAAMGYCQRDADPSLGMRNKEPERRQALWSHREPVMLAKGAWRAGYRGLAAIIAVAWDSSLSPVDVRTLTPAQRIKDDQGEAFLLAKLAGRPLRPSRAAPAAFSMPIWRALGQRLRQPRQFSGTAPGRPTPRTRLAMISAMCAP